MRRPSLRSQLNQIRLWVRQGRTDAWIAHKLDISVEQLEQFKRDQGLDGDQEPRPSPPPSRASFGAPDDGADEEEEEPVAEDVEPELPEPEPEPESRGRACGRVDRRGGATRAARGGGAAAAAAGGGARAGRTAGSFEATFDHGDEGYGLWLDPAVAENDVYAEHWAGHRAVSVTVEPDAITIRRVERRGHATARRTAD